MEQNNQQRLTDKDFAILYEAARTSQPDGFDRYLSEWSTSSIFCGDPDGPEPDWEYVRQALTSIWDVAHIDVNEILRRAGLNGADVIRRYGIPRRTVSSWRTKNPVEHRECPPWVRLMLAELTGVFKRP